MADRDNTLLNADEIYMDVEGESGQQLELEDDQKLNLVGIINSRFDSAEDARNSDEKRWITAFENYRGLYKKNQKPIGRKCIESLTWGTEWNFKGIKLCSGVGLTCWTNYSG